MSEYPTLRYFLPHKNFIITIKAIIILLILFSVFRVLFFAYYNEIFLNVSGSEVLKSFLIGIRFDLSAIMMFSSIFIFLLNIPGKFKFSIYYVRTILFFYFVIFVVATLILAGDIYYYDFVKRRLSYEIFNLCKSIPELFTIILEKYLIALIGFILLVSVLGCIWFKYLPKSKIKSKYSAFNDIVYFIIAIGLILILIRGGFQLKPLRESYAFRNENISLGHLSLNPVFTVIRTINRGDLMDYRFLDYEEGIKIVRSMLKDKNEQFRSKEYPLMREKIFGEIRGEELNVVIFVMESWPGDLYLIEGGTATPFFNKLMMKGRYFSRFFSTGQRTIQGIQAIIGSIPNVVYDDILGSPIEQHSLRQIGSILKESGYQTIFIHGARAGSMGFEAYSSLAGFDEYISKEDFERTKVKDDGTWGIFDHYVFERANEEFKKVDRPFLGVIVSLSSHAPYALPSKEFEYYDSSVSNHKFLNALRYSDWSLGQFFDRAEKSNYFKNTVFIITADHAEGTREKNIYELFHIPCLIYSPYHVSPGIDTSVHSQVDILPTVLDLLNLSTVHSSFGISMLSNNEGFAFFSTGNLFGWVRNNWLLVGDYDKSIGLYNIKDDKELFVNKLDNEKQVVEVLRREKLAYLQTAVSLLKNNKVYKISGR